MTIGHVGQGRDGNEGPDQSHPGAAFQFLAGIVYIVYIQHGDTLETIRIGLAEIDDPVVINSADSREELAVWNAIPEQALARLQASAPHTIHFELFDHWVWIVGRPPHVIPNPQEIDLGWVLEPL